MGFNPGTLNNNLSNLSSPTAANEDIDPASSDVESLGTHTNPWLNAYLNFLKDSSNVTTADLFNRLLADSSGATSIDFSSGSDILLHKSINFSAAGTFNVGSVGQPAASYFGIGYYMYDNFGDQIGYMAFVSPNSVNLAATFPGISPGFTAGTLNLLTANSNQMPTGAVTVKTGNGTGVNSGDVNIGTGNSDTGNAGDINLQPGVSSGNSNNSGGVNINDGNGLTGIAISPSARQAFDLSAILSADFDGRILYWDDGATPSIQWDNGFLGDNSGNNSLDWQNRQLLNAAGAQIASWASSNFFSISYPLLINTGGGTSTPTPTIQAAAGTGVNAYFQRGNICSDNGGLVQLGTGVGATAGEQGRVVFSSLNGTSCAVTISPGDAFTASQMVVNQIYVTVHSTYFSINFGVAGNNGNEYNFQYTCVGIS